MHDRSLWLYCEARGIDGALQRSKKPAAFPKGEAGVKGPTHLHVSGEWVGECMLVRDVGSRCWFEVLAGEGHAKWPPPASLIKGSKHIIYPPRALAVLGGSTTDKSVPAHSF